MTIVGDVLQPVQSHCRNCQTITWHDHPDEPSAQCWGTGFPPDTKLMIVRIRDVNPDKDLIVEWNGGHANYRPVHSVREYYGRKDTWESVLKRVPNNHTSILRPTLHVIQEAIHLEGGEHATPTQSET